MSYAAHPFLSTNAFKFQTIDYIAPPSQHRCTAAGTILRNAKQVRVDLYHFQLVFVTVAHLEPVHLGIFPHELG
jgi:hypothetical protein